MDTNLALGVASMFAVLMAAAGASELRPGPGKPLSQVVAALESEGYGPFHEVSFDDGVWEFETFKADEAVEVYVDPSGRTVFTRPDDHTSRPPANALPLSKVLATLEKQGFRDINEVDFDGQSWEIEATAADGRRELRVNVVSGELTSNRQDDPKRD